MKPILILYPPFEGKNYLKKRAPFPIGPLYLAAYLKQKKLKAYVKDFSYPPIKHKTTRPAQLKTGQSNYFRWGSSNVGIIKWLKNNLNKYHHVVGVSSLMSSNWTGAYKLIELIKTVDNNRVVIIGGPHATAFPNHVSRHSKADWICLGEGEDLFYNFLYGFSPDGIINAKEYKPNTPTRTKFLDDLNQLDFPTRDLLLDDRKTPELYVTFSRACPHHCSFCGSYLIQGRVWRNKTPARILEEINFYNIEWGVKHFVIEDDNPCPGKKGIEHLKSVCKLIIEQDLKLKFSVSHGLPVYATADRELCQLLYDAGFRHMTFPVESTNKDVLKHMKKETQSWKKSVKNWKYEKNKPVQIILGYPFKETIESMLQTMIDIANEKCLIWASHFRLNQGTELYDQCLNAGYIGKSYDPINTQAFFIETERFNKQDLQELMQISRASNYATESGFNIFDHETINRTDFKWLDLHPINNGDVVARGKFRFHKGQNVVASVRICINGTDYSRGRPMVAFGKDGESLVFRGMKKSRVYPILNKMVNK